MTDNSKNSEKRITHDNKSTVVITISLLLILIIFFAGYSIANGPNFDKFSIKSQSTRDDNFIIDDFDDQYSYLKNENKETIKKEDADIQIKEENITGEIDSKDKTFFENNFKDTISFKEPQINDNTENKQKNEEITNDSEKGKDINLDNEQNQINENNINIKEEENKKEVKDKNPIIQNVLSYDNKNIDKNISEENPYIIQVATHNHKTSAQHIRDILILEGFNSYIFKTNINDETKYRIRIGSFSTKREVLIEYKELLSKSKIRGIENSIILKRKY
jgi:cell division protein FtsN